MTTKKDLVIAVLATFCLTATLFMIIPTRSSPGVGDYDPWLDLDDSGTIDGTELASVARAFGTYGTSINKTALLLELQARIGSLNASFLSSEAYLTTRINTLETTVVQLQDKTTSLEERQNQFKTIRFFTANETYIPEIYGHPTEVAKFTWIPCNGTDNTILNAYLYFERKGDPPNWRFNTWVEINGQIILQFVDNGPAGPSYGVVLLRESSTEYRQTITIPFGALGVSPNQSEFTVVVKVGEAYGDSGRLWVRNINLLLTVMDGMPIS